MSYVDSKNGKVQPGGLVGAALINGAALIGMLLAAPEVYEKIKDVPIIADFNPQPDIPPPPPAPVLDKKDKDVKIVIPPVTNNRHQAKQGNDLAAVVDLGSGTELSSGDGGEIALPPPDPDPIPTPAANPVIKSPRVDPRYASVLQPEFPSSMIRAEIEGSVVVRVLVGVDGRVKDVQIVRAEHPDFAEATKRQALKKWRFIAGTSDGQPIESWREMTVRFEIPD